MIKNSVFFIFGVLLYTGTLQAKWHNLGSRTESPMQVQILQSDLNSTQIEFTVSGFEHNSIQIDGKDYQQISIPQTLPINEKDAPDLPSLSRDIVIPWNSNAQLRVLEVSKETVQIGAVAPSKGSLMRNINPDLIIYNFGKIYSEKTIFPADTVHLNKSFILRDVKGTNLTFNPIQYNPATNELLVTTHLVIEISHPSKGFSSLFRKTSSLDQGFENLYENHFLNFAKQKELMTRADIQHPVSDTGKMLIVSHPNFMKSMQPFVDWKIQRGFDVKLVSTADIGIGWAAIQDYVQKEYDTRQISYLILVGDGEFVATHPGKTGNANGNEADPMYALVAGNDTYPDLFVSRMSVKTVDDIENITTKIINYEKSPDQNGDWYSKGTGIASDQAGGGLIDYERANLLREMMLNWHFKSVDQNYDPKSSLLTLVDNINSGRGFINYIGHGSQTSWGTTNFSNSDIEKLHNGSKLPIIVSVACVNGDFTYSGGDSFAEKWLKVGSKTDPRGAVAIFASSTNQAWVEPTVGQKAITELLTTEKSNMIGPLFFNGSVAILESNMSEAIQTFETWHIFGDASLQVRTTTPTAIDAKLGESEVANELDILIGDDRISGAVFYNGEQVGRGFADKCGHLKIKLTKEIPANSKLTTVLTGFNKIPFTLNSVK